MTRTLSHRAEQAVTLLGRVARAHAPVVFASSFGAEDMVVFDLIARHALPIGVFTSAPGRAPPIC